MLYYSAVAVREVSIELLQLQGNFLTRIKLLLISSVIGANLKWVLYHAKRGIMMQKPIFEESNGNVFADIGLADADELFARGKIGIQVIRILKQRNLKRREISQLIGISQLEVSHLMNGDFQQFSEDKLLIFLNRLDREIT
jgi:predicted XRE-type DNA-binding protein